MEESVIKLIEKINTQAQKDYREKIRTKIYKEINELRKNDEFSKRLEREESYFWFSLLRENKDSNLKNLVKIYQCLNSLRLVTDEFKSLVNGDFKKIYLLNIIFILQSTLL